MTTISPAPERSTARRSRSRWLLLLAVAMVLGVGAAVIAVAVTGDDKTASAASFSQVEDSCGDWMSSPQANHPSDGSWCSEMFAWMSDQNAGSMMGSMMWQDARQMGRACREWVGQDHAEMGTSGPRGCDDMVEWMNSHMSSRNGNWMMHDG